MSMRWIFSSYKNPLHIHIYPDSHYTNVSGHIFKECRCGKRKVSVNPLVEHIPVDQDWLDNKRETIRSPCVECMAKGCVQCHKTGYEGYVDPRRSNKLMRFK